MSTRMTLFSCPGFHVYQDFAEGDELCVHIEFLKEELKDLPEDMQEHAGIDEYNGPVLKIPVALWECIRTFTTIDISMADWTDEYIRIKVEKDVSDRIQNYKEHPHGLSNIVGSLCYGLANDPQEDQIKSGIEYFNYYRSKIQHIRDMSRKYMSEFTPGPYVINLKPKDDAEESHG